MKKAVFNKSTHSKASSNSSNGFVVQVILTHTLKALDLALLKEIYDLARFSVGCTYRQTCG